MQFSKKAAYGLQTMTILALAYKKDKKQVLPLSALFAGEADSLSYLERTLRILRKANLLETVQGRDGGYRLAKSPSKITAREILEVLEGNLYPYKCLDKTCKSKTCLSKLVWYNLYESINSTLEKITLAKLINKR